jgi:hypothetical protein
MYATQHCFICHPSGSTVSEDAGIETGTVATKALYSVGDGPLPLLIIWNGTDYRARICKPFKAPKNRFPAWRPLRQPILTYRAAKIHRLAESIPEVLKCLQIQALYSIVR